MRLYANSTTWLNCVILWSSEFERVIDDTAIDAAHFSNGPLHKYELFGKPQTKSW